MFVESKSILFLISNLSASVQSDSLFLRYQVFLARDSCNSLKNISHFHLTLYINYNITSQINLTYILAVCTEIICSNKDSYQLPIFIVVEITILSTKDNYYETC